MKNTEPKGYTSEPLRQVGTKCSIHVCGHIGSKSRSACAGPKPGSNTGLSQARHLVKSLPIHLCDSVNADLLWWPLRGWKVNNWIKRTSWNPPTAGSWMLFSKHVKTILRLIINQTCRLDNKKVSSKFLGYWLALYGWPWWVNRSSSMSSLWKTNVPVKLVGGCGTAINQTRDSYTGKENYYFKSSKLKNVDPPSVILPFTVLTTTTLHWIIPDKGDEAYMKIVHFILQWCHWSLKRLLIYPMHVH